MSGALTQRRRMFEGIESIDRVLRCHLQTSTPSCTVEGHAGPPAQVAQLAASSRWPYLAPSHFLQRANTIPDKPLPTWFAVFWNTFIAWNLHEWLVLKRETGQLRKRLNPALLM
jgi:hypothetical protein